MGQFNQRCEMPTCRKKFEQGEKIKFHKQLNKNICEPCYNYFLNSFYRIIGKEIKEKKCICDDYENGKIFNPDCPLAVEHLPSYKYRQQKRDRLEKQRKKQWAS